VPDDWCSSCRHLFLDAALLMRGHPRDHLLQAWAGILQQQEEDGGVQQPSSPERLQKAAEALWKACASATLLDAHASDRQFHVR
jgi:hypothetical protein